MHARKRDNIHSNKFIQSLDLTKKELSCFSLQRQALEIRLWCLQPASSQLGTIVLLSAQREPTRVQSDEKVTEKTWARLGAVRQRNVVKNSK